MGNMAQGVAWMARLLGVPATIVAPDNAPTSKLAAVERLGARVVLRTHDDWWAAMNARRAEGIDGFFVHPVLDEPVMAGNGTIGLELVEDLESFDAVVVPWGGGGLTTGIASAVKALRPEADVYTCEPETAAPLVSAYANGGVPVDVPYTASFVDGAGSSGLLPGMWELARELVSESFRISLEEAAAGVRLLVTRAQIVAEGAAALTVAAAMAGLAGEGRVVCIVSGGNIDSARLAAIMDGRVPD
jgi:threonine dehydratase